ncbi:MAG: 4-(cytidine 5'-diphospho)-2-C-methyl-D-erythritol kinase, partial [Candidatus Binataceae bacterium]
LRSLLERAGALGAAMSGSGGAVFGVFPSPHAATLAAQSVRRETLAAKVFTAETLPGRS